MRRPQRPWGLVRIADKVDPKMAPTTLPAGVGLAMRTAAWAAPPLPDCLPLRLRVSRKEC